MMFGRAEIRKKVKFILVGSSTFALQTVVYYVFSRYVFLDLGLDFSYALAITYAVIFNYLGHKFWTFGDRATGRESVYRYISVAIASLLLSSLLFWLGTTVLQVFDMLVSLAVALVIPVFTYFTHRQFTFRGKMMYNT